MKFPLSKYSGCMMGALIGDCMGAPFECLTKQPSEILAHLVHFNNPDYSGIQNYTDDTALAWALAESLIECKGFDAKHMAKSFWQTYFKNTHRGYGAFVPHVFDKWKHDKVKDVFQPAREQFYGQGSYGNGGGMRVAPVALLAADDYSRMVEIAKQSTLLTHFHRNGYNGAILQCIAVWLVLREDSSQPLDDQRFVDTLIELMKAVETPQEGDANEVSSPEPLPMPFVEKLETVKEFLARDDVRRNEVIDNLGHSIDAVRSVPTAIYAFLRATKPIPDFPVKNPFERTIGLAITFGGDTDTIATMAGGIAGAYYGIEGIPTHLQTCCELHQRALKLAEKLHTVCHQKPHCSLGCV